MMRPAPIQLATACTRTGRYDECEPICGVDVVLTKSVLPRHHKSGCGEVHVPVPADTGWHSPRRASSTSARSKMRSRRIVRYSMAEWMTPSYRSTPSSSGVAARLRVSQMSSGCSPITDVWSQDHIGKSHKFHNLH
jgi:hypothetical protein